MIYEQDYLLRSIAQLIRFLAKIVFGKDTVTYELSEDEAYKESDNLHKALVALLSDGKINEAENLLFDEFKSEDNRHMMVALDFYRRLNDFGDEFLRDHDFSREEIEEGLREIASKARIV